jgi:hypothetical protein
MFSDWRSRIFVRSKDVSFVLIFEPALSRGEESVCLFCATFFKADDEYLNIVRSSTVTDRETVDRETPTRKLLVLPVYVCIASYCYGYNVHSNRINYPLPAPIKFSKN